MNHSFLSLILMLSIITPVTLVYGSPSTNFQINTNCRTGATGGGGYLDAHTWTCSDSECYTAPSDYIIDETSLKLSMTNNTGGRGSCSKSLTKEKKTVNIEGIGQVGVDVIRKVCIEGKTRSPKGLSGLGKHSSVGCKLTGKIAGGGN